MSWSYTRNEMLGIVEVVYAGDVSARELQEATSEFIGLEKREGLNRFLVDVADMTLARSTRLSDLFDLPAIQYEREKADRKGRVAVFAPVTSKVLDEAQFYESACINRGWNVRVFAVREEAVSWLTQPSIASAAN